MFLLLLADGHRTASYTLPALAPAFPPMRPPLANHDPAPAIRLLQFARLDVPCS